MSCSETAAFPLLHSRSRRVTSCVVGSLMSHLRRRQRSRSTPQTGSQHKLFRASLSESRTCFPQVINRRTPIVSFQPGRQSNRHRPYPMKTPTLVLAAIASALAIPQALSAAITSGGVTTVASDGVAPGSGTDYDFFGGGPQPMELSNFTVTAAPGAQYNPVATGITYSSLQPPGGGTVFRDGHRSAGVGAPARPYSRQTSLPLSWTPVRARTGPSVSMFSSATPMASMFSMPASG